jgi:two-component system response regulator AgrA
LLEIVICEDNKEYRNLIVENVKRLIRENKIQASIVLECDSPERVESFIIDHTPNVFLLDIDLNSKTNGLDLAAEIKKKLSQVYLVFISQYSNLVFKSFRVQPFDFLPKPIGKDDLENVLTEIAIDLAKKSEMETPEALNIKIGSRIYQIPKKEILFLEKFGNKCIVHTTNKTIHCYQSLDQLLETIDHEDFVRCHKSYIVNKSYIESVNLSDMELLLSNGQKCFIGGKYKKALVAKLSSSVDKIEGDNE